MIDNKGVDVNNKRKDRHVCNPVPRESNGMTHYQCGCGRYFFGEAVDEQNKLHTTFICEEFRRANKDLESGAG